MARRFLLLAAAICCMSALVVAATTTTTAPQVSPKMKAVIAADQHYHRLLAKTADSNLTATRGESFSTSYSYAVASKLMWHSVTAYCADDPALSAWTCNSCNQFGAFHITQIMDDTVNQGYVGYFTQGLPASPIAGVSAKSPFVLVSFRGTIPSDLSDWIEDLSASKFAAFSDQYPDVSVHEGFWNAYQSLKPGMMDGIATALKASGATTILLTGHSLGGAMAEAAAIDLKLNEYPSYKYASYTQGTPRLGNQAFADLYLEQVDASFREIHYHDIVPHLPPELLGFRHAPTELWFTEDFASYTTCSSSDGEDSNCSDSVLAPISIPDHLTYRGVDLGGYCSTSSVNAAAPVVTPASLQQLQKDLQERKLKEAAQKRQAKPKKNKIILTEN